MCWFSSPSDVINTFIVMFVVLFGDTWWTVDGQLRHRGFSHDPSDDSSSSVNPNTHQYISRGVHPAIWPFSSAAAVRQHLQPGFNPFFRGVGWGIAGVRPYGDRPVTNFGSSSLKNNEGYEDSSDEADESDAVAVEKVHGNYRMESKEPVVVHGTPFFSPVSRFEVS